MTATADPPLRTPAGTPAKWLRAEVWLVFAVSLGADGLRALIHLLADLTNGQSLTSQTATLNGSQAPGRPWLDLTLQLVVARAPGSFRCSWSGTS